MPSLGFPTYTDHRPEGTRVTTLQGPASSQHPQRASDLPAQASEGGPPNPLEKLQNAEPHEKKGPESDP